MRRAVHLALLSLLLLVMQQQVLVHPIAHLTGHASPAQETAFAPQQPEQACLECALTTGGFTGLHVAFAPLGFGESANGLVFHSYHSRAGEVPAWFQSRAPPVLL